MDEFQVNLKPSSLSSKVIMVRISLIVNKHFDKTTKIWMQE